jgi:hypothetical protein
VVLSFIRLVYPPHRCPSAALLASEEPWVRHSALLVLEERGYDDSEVVHAREEMLAHPTFSSIILGCMGWPGKPITRHNGVTLLMHKLAFLANWGLDASDERIGNISRCILETLSPEEALQSLVQVSAAFGGSGDSGMG